MCMTCKDTYKGNGYIADEYVYALIVNEYVYDI